MHALPIEHKRLHDYIQVVDHLKVIGYSDYDLVGMNQ